MIDLCSHYTTTGYPTLNPKCKIGLRAGLKCHSHKCKCHKYVVTEKEVNHESLL